MVPRSFHEVFWLNDRPLNKFLGIVSCEYMYPSCVKMALMISWKMCCGVFLYVYFRFVCSCGKCLILRCLMIVLYVL